MAQKIVNIGIPPIYDSESFKDSELFEKHFMSFIMIPLHYDQSFGYVIDTLQPVQNKEEVPWVKIYPKEPPTITYTVGNALDETWLSSFMGTFSKLGAISRSLGVGFDPSKYASMFENVWGLSGISALLKAAGAYGVALPKVWTSTEWSITLRLEVEEHLWAWGKNAPERFREVMNAIKNFIAPRTTKPTASNTNGNQEGEKTVASEVKGNNESSHIANYFYSQPYFCRLVSGRNQERQILPAAIVSNANINIDTKDMASVMNDANQILGTYPRILKIELEFTPLHFTLVADPENKLENKNLMSFEKLIKGWVS